MPSISATHCAVTTTATAQTIPSRADGTAPVWTADLVVGADGSGSLVRQLVADQALENGQYAGYVGWRGWLLETEAPEAAREAVGECFVVCKVRSFVNSL